MDIYAMGIAMGAVDTAAMANVTQTAETQEPDVSFATLLGQMAGTTNATNTQMADEDVVTGLSWREVQMGMMLQVMKNTDEPVVVDPQLMELLSQMKSLLAGGGEEAEAEGIQQILSQLKKRLEEIAQENGGQMAGAQAMAMLNNLMDIVPGAMANPATQELVAQAPENVLQYVLDTEPGEMLSLITDGQITVEEVTPEVSYQQVAEQLQTETPQQAVAQKAEVPQNVTQPAVQHVQAETTQNTEKAEVGAKTVQVNAQNAEQNESTQAVTLNKGESFEAAVGEAKQQMNAGAENTEFSEETQSVAEAEENDFEAMQQRVDAGEYLRGTAVNGTSIEKAASEINQVPVTTQLEEGITQGLAKGDDEFTITLRPAELGDVTIKLNRTESGITMEIVAKNAETQKLLASEINVIKETLKPMNVEVESILTQQQDAFLNGQSNFGGHNMRNWDMHGAAYYGDEPLGETDEEIQPQPVAAPSTVLDAYI